MSIMRAVRAMVCALVLMVPDHGMADDNTRLEFVQGAWTVVSNPLIAPQAGSGITTMATADLNQDGIMDIVYGLMVDTIDARVPLRILLGNGDGTFREATTELIAGPVPKINFPNRILFADFNSDGRPDIFIAATGYDRNPWPGEPNVLLLSTPDGHLVDSSDRLPRENGYSHGAAIADINGSGFPSIYIGGYWGGPKIPPYLLINDGRANFRRCGTECLPSDIAAQLRNGSAYVSAAFGDVNGDGFPDLILGGDMDSGTRLLLNDRQGRFVDAPVQPPSPLFGSANTNSVSILATDVDGDGRPDFIISQTRQVPFYSGRALQLLMSNGDGTFRDETVSRLGSGAIDPAADWSQLVRTADVNGDGFIDLYTVGMFGTPPNLTQPFIWLNDGRGYFTPVSARSAGVVYGSFFGLGVTRPGSLPDIVTVYTDAKGDPGYQTSLNVLPIKPSSGWWWNPAEGGRGYALEVRGSSVFFAAFMYDDDGEARWYVASGTVTGGVFEADLQRYGGPGTGFWGPTTGVASLGSVGRIRIAFSSTRAGIMSWPGGTTAIERFDLTANGSLRGRDSGLPESGWYFDPSQGGKGWYIEYQGRQAFFGFFTYSQGRPVWLVASATLTSSMAPMLEAPLSIYCCGRSFLGGGNIGQYAGSVGQMTLTFQDGAHAVARLPDGSSVSLSRFRF